VNAHKNNIYFLRESTFDKRNGEEKYIDKFFIIKFLRKNVLPINTFLYENKK